MSPRDVREVRIVFDASDDLSVRSADPEEGGEIARSSDVQPWTTRHGSSTRVDTDKDFELEITRGGSTFRAAGPFDRVMQAWEKFEASAPAASSKEPMKQKSKTQSADRNVELISILIR